MKNNRGITIIETLVVLGIALIIIALCVVMILAAGREGRDVKRLSDVDSLRSALATIRVQYGSYLESGCSTGLIANCTGGKMERVLPSIKNFHDPKGTISCAQNCTTSCDYAFSEDLKADSYTVLFYLEGRVGNFQNKGCYKLTVDGINQR